MKTKLLFFAITLMMAIFISSCGGSGTGFSSSSNDYLNYLPSIAKKYEMQIEAKKKAIHDNTSIEDAFKLEKELDLLKEEWAAKIKESSISNPVSKALPFDALADAPYTINKISVDHANKSNLAIKFDVTVNQDIKNEYGGFEKTLFVYFLALDKSGNEIPKVISVGVSSNRTELKAGTACNLSATLSPLANLEDFAKLKMITREEYDQKKK
jgi:hypothetical protein